MPHLASMSRRPAHAYLLALGRAIATARKASGLTVQQLADNLSIDLRNAHELEAGTQNLSVLRLRRVAEALASTPSALLAAAESVGTAVHQAPDAGNVAVHTEATWSRELRSLGWRPLEPNSRAKGMPVWSLVSTDAGGATTATPVVLGHVRASGRQFAAGLVLVQAVGPARAELPEGAWCVLATPLQEPRVRAIILICIPAAEQVGACRWQFRRISAVQCDGDQCLQIRLDRSDSAEPAEWVKLPDDGNTAPRAVGEVVKVLEHGART
jgi:transcriptional regulator with XRE-family HTH domain